MISKYTVKQSQLFIYFLPNLPLVVGTMASGMLFPVFTFWYKEKFSKQTIALYSASDGDPLG